MIIIRKLRRRRVGDSGVERRERNSGLHAYVFVLARGVTDV
jgi:hypothetical protein